MVRGKGLGTEHRPDNSLCAEILTMLPATLQLDRARYMASEAPRRRDYLVKGVLLLALRDPIRSCWHEFKGEGQDGGRNSRGKTGFPQELGTACPPYGRMEIPFAGKVHNFLLVDSDVIPCRKWTTQGWWGFITVCEVIVLQRCCDEVDGAFHPCHVFRHCY
jgi:hypothetical protein